MLAGPILGVAYVALAYVLYDGLLSLLVDESTRSKGTETAIASGLWLASTVVYFGGGHTCSFDGLHFAVAFTGFRKFNFYGMGFLLGFETWSGEIILAVAIPLFAFALTQSEPYESFQRLAVRVSMKVALFRALAATCATLCAFIHRRHLMVWAIFAPKFVFDAIGSTVADICGVLAVLTCVSHRPFEHLKRA
jgi:phosphatidylinositol glycan class O